MSLNKYLNKRSFDSTPEPEGQKKKKSKKLCFVVQKHAASHLHYDFRLEMDGVLKSWAVPKGPSLDPKDKRLAMRVEDHPYDYKDFEGVIPKGNYGAGTVVIWDKGKYEFSKPPTLKKGSLKFILYGKKLRGEFSLVKIKSKDKNKDNSWLLIKINDQFAAKKNQTPIPKNIHPMLAHLAKKAFNRPGWIFEIKWDGYRIISYIYHNQVQLLSRRQQDYTSLFAPISEELASLKFDAVLDGEVVVVDSAGKAKFQLLQQYQQTGAGLILYYVFDILWLNGEDLTQLPLIERRRLLKEFLPDSNSIRISEFVEESGQELFKLATKQDLEGIIAKNKDSLYSPGQRSHNWLKIKAIKQEEAIICGYTAPRGSRSHIGALILGMYIKQQLTYVGHVGTGLSEINLSDLKKRLDQLKQINCPFAQKPHTNMPVTWVKPQTVAEIKFREWTEESHLRQPVFLGLREDKKAVEISPEQTQTEEKIVKIGQYKIKITNLTKVYWPEEEITKGDFIQYYQKVASFILPYLKNYPESLHRFPDGIHGEKFFQKNIETAPDWVETQIVHSKHENRDIRYLICQNKATLIYLSQLGCIEMNPWLSRIKTLDFPDYCVLDLDPEDIEFTAVVKTAQTIHKLLEKIKVYHLCKTSGATGLHIYIPLKARYSYQQSGQFAELIATIVNEQIPEITSIERSPSRRQGKVYIDFLQNRRGQTVAAPYSLRPRRHAPVSTPLTWKEVNNRLDPNKFNINSIHQRLKKSGDLWKPLINHKGIDLESSLSMLKKRYQGKGI